MFVVVTIKDLKYYLQRDELISLLMFATLGPAYLYNSVAGCCVSHYGACIIKQDGAKLHGLHDIRKCFKHVLSRRESNIACYYSTKNAKINRKF